MTVKTDRHGKWYHFYEMRGAGMDKTGKIIVTAPKGRLWREAGVVGGRGTKLPLSCVIEWTLFSFHEWEIASRITKASPLGSR